MKNRDLIDRFKKANSIEFDLDLAFIYGLSKQHISAWTRETRPIPTAIKFRMLVLMNLPGAADFAAFFMDEKQLAEDVKKDRKAIDNLRKMAAKATELLDQDEKDRAATDRPPKKRK